MKTTAEMYEGIYLEITLEKTVFTLGEPINIIMTCKNSSNRHLVIDGILPIRQSASAPSIEVFRPNKSRFRTLDLEGVSPEILHQGFIEVAPKSEIILVKADLMTLTGCINQTDQPDQIGKNGKFTDHLRKGKYFINGNFYPTQFMTKNKTDAFIWHPSLVCPLFTRAPIEFEIK